MGVVVFQIEMSTQRLGIDVETAVEKLRETITAIEANPDKQTFVVTLTPLGWFVQGYDKPLNAIFPDMFDISNQEGTEH